MSDAASSTPSNKAGSGSAAYGNTATAAHEATREETVTAEVGSSGTSELTAREPEQRTEASARSTRDVAIEFLKVQEDALAAEPLPLSRRAHVLRYFTALRKRLEQEPGPDTGTPEIGTSKTGAGGK